MMRMRTHAHTRTAPSQSLTCTRPSCRITRTRTSPVSDPASRAHPPLAVRCCSCGLSQTQHDPQCSPGAAHELPEPIWVFGLLPRAGQDTRGPAAARVTRLPSVSPVGLSQGLKALCRRHAGSKPWNLKATPSACRPRPLPEGFTVQTPRIRAPAAQPRRWQASGAALESG